MKRLLIAAGLLILAACQPTSEPTAELPTLAALPSATPTIEVSETPSPTAEVRASPEATDLLPFMMLTETPTPTSSSTPTATRTPRPVTPQPTLEPTRAAVGTATQAVLEAPRFVTFTPGPGAAGGAPQQFADVVINEQQFQEELTSLLSKYPDVDQATIDFVPEGINVRMRVFDGSAFVSGNVMVSVVLTGDFATITISSITIDGGVPSQFFVDTATGPCFLLALETLDTILKQRLGPDQNLQSVVMTDTEMLISLLVPAS
ncbi:MAG: hypothetical protein JNM70_21360 [Anaerolineae bacterium]|nr:hypothetical protein [Anaerolineae bacterium]